MASLLSRLKISTKILALLLMLGVVTVTLALLASQRLNDIDARYSVLVTKSLPDSTRLARVSRITTAMGYSGYRTLAYEGSSKEARDADADEQAGYASAIKLLDQVKTNEPDKAAIVDEARERLDRIHKLVRVAIARGLADRNDEARAALISVDREIDTLTDRMMKTNNANIEGAEKVAETLAADADYGSMFGIVLGVLASIVAVVVGLLVSRAGIVGPLARLQATMRELAQGDNRVEVPGIERRDEVGAMAQAVLVFRDAAQAQEITQAEKARADAEQKLVVDSLEKGLASMAEGDLTASITADFSASYVTVKTNFNQAIESLRGLIGSVMTSAETIRTGSGEIAAASEDLARRTESNAASLEETSAAISQMETRLKATAAAAGRTVERADGAISTVSGGRGIADEAMGAMNRVSESAKGIDSVIEGLDKIAFQTRVLAMNAAVEAGRAGEAGRGFAVVADLVSALAMRAEEEAGRARDQLTATQTDIVAAVEMVQKVDGALANISGDVDEVHKLLAEMASDNAAQSSAIVQISAAIGTMDQSTQQNAAMVEETSAAARNLSSEVTELADKASHFNTGDAGARATRSTPLPAKPRAARSTGYVSPVQPLPVAAMTTSAGGDDWTSF
ncbi:methyl-accepting chemotaxis protein [Sphingomonas sp.]|uniref:methyl-accepting chemotaxis protein n=1 Tax=Sphingomonas sp. TaxID=28214 RepID=UPI0025D11F8D|nr:methyl-accepting chemotaxis protein [Sphingomonas sp.]